MTPSPRHPSSGHDRWLVSYADLVTLLLAFFTTLYAASAVKATTPAPPPASERVSPEMRPVPVMPSARREDPLRARLAARLENDVRLARAEIVRDGRGIVVSLPESATFKVGSADVTTDAKPVIARVIDELRDGAYMLRIEGHTDDVPIQTSRYPSNWELSTARAGAVVAYLIRELHFAPERLSAAGYAEFHPLVPNDSPANRARNRRIDIVVIEGAGGEAGESSAE